jgi:type III secretion protein J
MRRSIRSSARSLRAAPYWLLLTALCGIACAVPVATGLDESDANRAVLALVTKGVAADKELDPDGEGSWRVNVARDEASAAAAVLARESLPRPKAAGLLEALGGDSLVPSRLSEHARLIAGTAGELERSLSALEGVLSARVHVALAARDNLDFDQAPPPVTASVLLKHRGATPPIAVADVQRLVAGAVPGLRPDLVSVVATPTPATSRDSAHELTRVGPLTLARGSMPPLRWFIGGIAVVNIGLIALLLVLWSRVRKAELALEQARVPEALPGSR